MKFDKKMLACECVGEQGKEENGGILTSVISCEGIDIVKTVIKSEASSKMHGREAGTYLTVCQGELYKSGEFLRDKLARAVSFSLTSLISELNPTPENFLFVGLGNRELSSDKIGVTIYDYLAPIKPKNRHSPALSLISPGVTSSGGIEALDHIRGLIKTKFFDCVIVADSLLTTKPERLLTTVQISSTGITPASGTRTLDTENTPKMREISHKTLGIPVISLGVPTVIALGDKLYTPYTIDLEIEPIAKIIAEAINFSLTGTGGGA